MGHAQRDGRPAEYRWRPLLNAVHQIAKIFAPSKFPLGGKSPQKCVLAHETAKHHAVWLTSAERRWCSNEAKMRNPLRFAGVLQLTNRSQPLVG